MKPDTKSSLLIGSPSFNPGGHLPSKFTCQGENINPAITIQNIPPGTFSMTLILDDPDARGETFVHWVVWNIKPSDTIRENNIPGTEGTNSSGGQHYVGPCPPSGTHRYFFKVFALDTLLTIRSGSDKATVDKAMQNHILGYGELMGLYKKS